MVNYQNGKIYKIISSCTDKINIGSTTVKLSVRLARHRKGIKEGSNFCHQSYFFTIYRCKNYFNRKLSL